MKRSLSIEAIDKLGQELVFSGWVNSRRDHGGLVFIDLRDHKGILQIVFTPDQKEAYEISQKLRDEYVIKIKGLVRSRDASLINPKLPTGTIELVANQLTILSSSEALPINIFGENASNEEQRFKYRYLDLRTEKAQRILARRAEFNKFIRAFMEENDFTEVATPILASSSPEGARDFLVPSRVHPGKFYALPQSPQQFKQLLMVGGLHRYYQIAACFRDEDPRADRLYGDFYHLDLEMSFVEDGLEVRKTMEPLIKSLVKEFANKKLLTEDIPTISYQEAMNVYGSDKPDLRFDLKLIDLSASFKNSGFEVFSKALHDGGVVKAILLPNGATLSRSKIDQYTELAKKEGAKGLAYITKEDGQLKSPILKFLSAQEIEDITNKTGFKDNDLLFFGADQLNKVNKVLGSIRSQLGSDLQMKDDKIVSLLWVVDFPMYEWNENEQKLDFGHNPFSMPKGGLPSLDKEDKLDIVADQYDLVMNGYEICSGAIRNHDPNILYKVFSNLGYPKEEVDQKFGALANAFKYGAPPHGGCAFGLDRIFMILEDQENIREVLAFPKNGSGVDLMMNSPTPIDQKQLKELNLISIV